MGIFDEVIREHLELKRQTGADEDELRELEDEAFGPPARPGDPDFPGSTSDTPAVDEPEAEGGDEASEAGETGNAEAETALFDAQAAAPESPSEMAIPEAPAGEDLAPPPVKPTPPEPQAELVEEPEVVAAPDDSADAEVEEIPADEGAPSFTTAEREAIADQPTVFFDQAPAGELELGDLDLDLDEEIEEVGGAMDDPPAGEEPREVEADLAEEPEAAAEPLPTPAPAAEAVSPPVESPAQPEPEPEAEPEAQHEAEPQPEAEPETGTAEEDVLEETPEFLRDNPDDDELWFEQGEPKDFDF